MNILIAGGSGFVGSHLGPFLASKGHQVTLLTRQHNLILDGYQATLSWVKSIQKTMM
jgi:uncharacterized protein